MKFVNEQMKLHPEVHTENDKTVKLSLDSTENSRTENQSEIMYHVWFQIDTLGWLMPPLNNTQKISKKGETRTRASPFFLLQCILVQAST